LLDLPDLGVPADENPGICVCEFEGYSGMGHSRVSYHVRKLKDAGLVREERRGKWSFYSLDEEAVRGLLDIARGAAIGVAPASGGEEAGAVISAARQAGGFRS
jgi:DNA-binding transcriptional ArsR family regulator